MSSEKAPERIGKGSNLVKTINQRKGNALRLFQSTRLLQTTGSSTRRKKSERKTTKGDVG